MKTTLSRSAVRLATIAGLLVSLTLALAHDAAAQTSTTTSLTSGPNPSNVGGTVTLTATVVPGAATGTVEFFDGATSLGTATLSAGVATLGVSSLAAGTHTLTAVYSGDGTYSGSTSTGVSQVVNSPGTSTVTAVSPAGTISPATPSVSVAVTLSRTDTTPIMGFSVDFTVSSNLGSTSSGITQGDFLGASGTPTQFQVRDLGGGHYVADGVTLGSVPQCGSSATSGTLFSVALTSSAASGPGTVTINSVTLRDCNNATMPSTAVSPASVAIDNTPPSVAVDSPAGGETWIGGSAHPITWTATDASGVATVDLESSIDGGGSWAAVATGIANSGSFSWTVPNTPSATALVRVTAHDVNGNSASATSAAVFTISGTTSTALGADVNPSVYGQTVTLTATVTPASAGGTVTFLDGATPIGTASLASGTATLAVASLAVATHSLTAQYGGDATHQPSVSAPLSQVVDKAATTAALVADVNPSSFAQTVNLTATVAPVAPGGGTPDGSVEFFDGATSLGTVALAGGSAALAVSSLAPGNHSLTAVYGGSGSYTGATSPALSHDVNPNATTTTVASGTNPSVFGESVTFTATVSPAAATGTVEFHEGATVLGTGTLASGTATFATAALAAGPHSVTAVYLGTTGYTGSTSSAITQTVNQAATTTALVSSANPSTYGASVTFTATVAPVAPGGGAPSGGTVEFRDGASVIGTGTLAAGVATFTTSALAGGDHAMTAVFAGDASYLTSTSSTLTQTVNTATASVALGTAPNPSTYGQSVTLTATVTPSAATGTVNFLDGATLLGSGTLASGVATFATSALAGGAHTLTAQYLGDGNHGAATSPPETQTVNTAATSVALASSANPSVFQASVTLTATVTPAGATGTVSFLDGATPIGSGTLASGVATLAIASLAVGAHSLTAQYASDGNYAGSTSAPLTQTVQASIVATAGPNGTLTPLGATLWNLNDTPSFAFAAASGYHVSAVTVDGVAAPLTSPYAFTPPITANHTIDVQFAVNPAVPAITALAAATVRSGNDASGIAAVSVSWPAVAAGSIVHVYRAPYGNYPEYDDGATPGTTPTPPSGTPAAPWTLAGSVAAPGTTLADKPPVRDFWYYVAIVEDQYGTLSPVSNMTGGSLDYFLGDVTNGTPGTGDNQVGTADISLLGAHYGVTLGAGDPLAYLDVGPTTDYSVNGRPITDNVLEFEDLVMFAINYGTVSGPQARAVPAPAASDEVVLEAPASVGAGDDVTVRLLLHGTGRVQGLSTHLAWDPAVVQPVRTEGGALVLQQGGVVLSAKPGSVDAAVLGTGSGGLSGEGEMATVTFHVLAAGDPKFAVKSVDARDAANRRITVASALQRPAPVVPQVTSLAPAAPNPFSGSTAIAFGLSRPGSIELTLFGVDGRRVRTLASGAYAAGLYRLTWDGRDDGGRTVAAGVYWARLETAQGRFTKKVTFTR